MSRKDLALLNLLSAKVGIKTAVELEAFKTKTQASTNDALLKKLALCVAFDRTLEEVLNNEYI